MGSTPAAERAQTFRILIVDDDPAIGRVLRMYLAKEGFAVDLAGNGREGLEAARTGIYDAMILDVMLPEKDGWQVCRQLRDEGSRLPILMLSARADELDRVLGLDLGADDYMVKPFSPKELAARIPAVLRRVDAGPADPATRTEGTGLPAAGVSAEEPAVRGGEQDAVIRLDGGRVCIDPFRRSLIVKGKEVPLTAREFDLLYFLGRRPGVVFSREQLLDEVWGYDYAGGSRTVDEHVRKLRRKLHDAGHGNLIRTVRGVGYACAEDRR